MNTCYTIAFMSEQTRMKRLKQRENCIFVHEWQKLIDKRSEWKTLSISCQNHFKWLIFVNRYLFILIPLLNFTPLILLVMWWIIENFSLNGQWSRIFLHKFLVSLWYSFLKVLKIYFDARVQRSQKINKQKS